MIDEIFQEYKKQEKDNILLMTKHYGIDVKCLLYPNINNDLIVILDSVNLLNDEVDSFKLIDAFYEKIKAKGFEIFRELKVNGYRVGDIVYEDKEFLIQDPDGYLLRFNN